MSPRSRAALSKRRAFPIFNREGVVRYATGVSVGRESPSACFYISSRSSGTAVYTYCTVCVLCCVGICRRRARIRAPPPQAKSFQIFRFSQFSGFFLFRREMPPVNSVCPTCGGSNGEQHNLVCRNLSPPLPVTTQRASSAIISLASVVSPSPNSGPSPQFYFFDELYFFDEFCQQRFIFFGATTIGESKPCFYIIVSSAASRSSHPNMLL